MPSSRPIVFVSDSSPAVQQTLRERLDEVGMQAYLSRSPTAGGGSVGEYLGGLTCALVTLERADGNDDPITEAMLLRMYQPNLPLAFLHERASFHMLERAKELGPVFRKRDQVDRAIRWIVDFGTRLR
jgi:hypothetical protein